MLVHNMKNYFLLYINKILQDDVKFALNKYLLNYLSLEMFNPK